MYIPQFSPQAYPQKATSLAHSKLKKANSTFNLLKGEKNEEKRKGGREKRKRGRIVLLKSGEGFQDAGKGDGKNFKLGWGIYNPEPKNRTSLF